MRLGRLRRHRARPAHLHRAAGRGRRRRRSPHAAARAPRGASRSGDDDAGGLGRVRESPARRCGFACSPRCRRGRRRDVESRSRRTAAPAAASERTCERRAGEPAAAAYNPRPEACLMTRRTFLVLLALVVSSLSLAGRLGAVPRQARDGGHARATSPRRSASRSSATAATPSTRRWRPRSRWR